MPATTQPTQSAVELPTLGARFRVLRELGRGGNGVVYEALDLELNQRVALKALRAMNPDALLRFKNEFREFQNLHHVNLVSMGELFSEDGEWYFTMELLQGHDFLTHVRSGLSAGPTAETQVLPAQLATHHSSPDSSNPGGYVFTGARGLPVELARLRPALANLTHGLLALHDAGKVHRDVKPSNIMVTPSGRVVVLDFGLACDVTTAEASDEAMIVGTVAYMAPEQAAARHVGPPADWYAVGCILYEALTGSVPFAGRALDVMTNKQTQTPRSPLELSPNAPPELAELCMELMRFNPASRPGGKEILARLGQGHAEGPGSTSLGSLGERRFIGRGKELQTLRAGFDQARKGSTCAVTITGESGQGKTALVREFSRQVEREGAIVLKSTCYERESLPYKAIDGAIDALSRYLSRVPRTDVEAILPPNAALLPHVFPVLGRVEVLGEQRARLDVKDPLELRRRLFAALRQLLRRLSYWHPVVLVIDDLQWADADSLLLLAEVLRAPEAPSLLLLSTLRADGDERVAWEERVSALVGGNATGLPLSRMPAEDARELALTLMRRQNLRDDALAAAVAAEAAGHPLFIDELLRHATAGGSPGRAALTLEDALGQRTHQLEPELRTVLQLISLSVGRSQQQIVGQAAGVDWQQLARWLGQLRVAQLVRTTGMRQTDYVEPFHDRVRMAVLSKLDPAAGQKLHRRLASALETSEQADPEALTVHWREAGENDRAAHFAELAAEKAYRTLAFDRAAHFLSLCLQLAPGDEDSRRERTSRLADALSKAGRGAEAADAYARAAAGAHPTVSLELRRQGAEQLLRCGHVDRGLMEIGAVLEATGLKLASTPQKALLSLLWSRARLSATRLRFREVDSSKVSPEALMRIDATWSAAYGLSMVDPIRGADLQTTNLLLALKAGEPYRFTRGLAMEAGFRATAGKKMEGRSLALAQTAETLAERLGHPHAIGLAKCIRGVIAFQNGHWASARTWFENAVDVLRARCTGVTCEIESSLLFKLEALFWMGEVRQLSEEVPNLLNEAEARGDLYALTNLRLSHINFVWLAADDASAAAYAANDAVSGWSGRGYLAQHFYHLAAMQNVDLYREDGAAAWRRVTEQWPLIRKSMLLRVQLIRIWAWHLYGRAALAAGLSKEAGVAARKIEAEHVDWGDALACLLNAGQAALTGQRDRALELLERGRDRASAADMRLYAAAAAWHLGRLRKERGAQLVEASERFMLEQRIKVPARIANVLVTGMPAE